MATAFLVPAFWSEYLRFRDAFAEVLDPVFYTIEWLDGQVWSGIFKLFTCDDSAIVVSVKTYPTGAKELHGQIAVGNLAHVIGDLIPLAEQFGRDLGCVVAVIESREGWGKVMKDYELHQVSLRKAL